MSCQFCPKKARCKHQVPEGSAVLAEIAKGARLSLSEETAPPLSTKPVTNSEPINLFALGDRHELVCVLCAKAIPNGRGQAYLRAHHGQQHVRAGEATEIRNGLPEGAVRYLVKTKVTA